MIYSYVISRVVATRSYDDRVNDSSSQLNVSAEELRGLAEKLIGIVNQFKV